MKPEDFSASVSTATLQRRIGWLALGLVTLTVIEVPLYFIYDGPPPDTNILVRLLVTIATIIGILTFFASFRGLVVSRSQELEPLATLLLAVVVVYSTLTLVAGSLEGGLAIASTANVDPTIAAPGTYLIYGAIGRVLTASILGLAGYLSRASGLLPQWSSRLAYALAAFSLAFVPSLFFGNDPTFFFAANGWGTTALAGSSIMYWFLAVGSTMVFARRIASSPPPLQAKRTDLP